MYNVTLFALLINQNFQLHCVNPTLITTVNTLIFYLRYQHNALLSNTVVNPKILSSVNVCGCSKWRKPTNLVAQHNSCTFPLMSTGTVANTHTHPPRKVGALFGLEYVAFSVSASSHYYARNISNKQKDTNKKKSEEKRGLIYIICLPADILDSTVQLRYSTNHNQASSSLRVLLWRGFVTEESTCH